MSKMQKKNNDFITKAKSALNYGGRL